MIQIEQDQNRDVERKFNDMMQEVGMEVTLTQKISLRPMRDQFKYLVSIIQGTCEEGMHRHEGARA